MKYTKQDIHDILKGNYVQDELKQAILSGKSTNWGYNEEAECEEEFDTFNEEVALENVLLILNKYIGI